MDGCGRILAYLTAFFLYLHSTTRHSTVCMLFLTVLESRGVTLGSRLMQGHLLRVRASLRRRPVISVTQRSRSPPNGGRAGIPSSRSVPVYHMDSLRTVEQRPEGGSRRAAREGAADSPLRPDSLTQSVHSTVQSESPSLRRRVTFLSQVSSHFFHPADRLPPHNSSSEMASVPPEVSTQGPSKALQRFKVGTPSSLGAHQLGATPAFPAHPEPHSYPAVKAPPGSNAPAAAL